MRQESGKSVRRPTRLAREKLVALTHPLRAAIVSSLSRDPSTARQLAAVLGDKPERVRYQLRRMREVDLVQVVGTTRTEGARENLYSVDPARFVITEEELASFTPEESDRSLASIVRLMFRESVSLLGDEPNTEREDFVVRLPMPLDSAGWSEASMLLNETAGEVLRAGRESLERLAQSEEAPIRTVAMVLLYALAENAAQQAPIEPRTGS